MSESTINIIYISIEGNTRSFVTGMQDYAKTQNAADDSNPLITLKEITDQSDFAIEDTPYFAFVPTYLNGGNGIDSGVTELLTTTLGEYLNYDQNSRFCLGVVGSGNRNFNDQYCLTARRYAEQLDTDFIADYELRGTSVDTERVYNVMKDRLADYQDRL
ncbi:class Ib ribonucleoside-diphosphate reductase assembly flavoprotein NrdI [Lactiplantibacillus herbarum]|uniref:class Ib ribonucleoside-diphosphate reductase assembly flavoprotein NrdI n=1 Tax=Lactiplantibacillus herbarum TaxID=1670446 RepID=UPI00065000DC|nr:class Ib ribonucleoside-diphosphate reductase assembly flavoprotein NrdI [Lactiplantibacillus herbarum]